MLPRRRKMDRGLGCGEFGDALTAAAARRRGLGAPRSPTAIATMRRAPAATIAAIAAASAHSPSGYERILDIGADMDAAVLGAHRRADPDAGIGRIGVLAHGYRRRDQGLGSDIASLLLSHGPRRYDAPIRPAMS